MNSFGNMKEQIEQSKLELMKVYNQGIEELKSHFKKQNKSLEEFLENDNKKLKKDIEARGKELFLINKKLSTTMVVSVIIISALIGFILGGTLMKYQIQKKQDKILKILEERL